MVRQLDPKPILASTAVGRFDAETSGGPEMGPRRLRRDRRGAFLSLMAVGCACWVGAALADVSARFDRDEVHEGETVQLVIESDRMVGEGPDLGVLATDFEVRGTAASSQIQIINGRQSATRSWQIVLAPKRSGVIEVPPIPVGDEQTAPLRLEVSDAPQGAIGAVGDDVFLEIEVGGEGEPVYVQQQLPVAVRLFSALPLRTGEISEPRAEGAVVERLGDDVQYQTEREGREYQVIERRFSLSPERSGELRIPPIRFTGELRTAGRGGVGRAGLPDIFRDPVFDRFSSGVFGRGEPVRARTEAVTLDVLPVPDGFAARHWLPARALTIDDSWAQDPPNFVNGEPVVRELTITAAGLSGSQLPQLDMPAPDGVRAYGDPAEAETRTDGKSLFGVSRQAFTLMPARGGELRFPEVRLAWWDLNAGEERVAVVPARVFDATGAVRPSSGEVAPDVSAARLDPATAEAGDASEPSDAQGSPAPRAGEPRRPLFLLPVLIVLALLWLLWSRRRAWADRFAGLLIPIADVFARMRGRRAAAATVTPGLETERRPGLGGDPYAGLRTAAANNDAPACARELLVVARGGWPDAPPSSLGEIAARLETLGGARALSAARLVRALDAALYGPSADHWTGAALADVVPAALADLAGRRDRDAGGDLPLPPLYPGRDGA